MNKTQRAALRRFRRVQDFLSEHPPAGTAEVLGKQAQVLDEVIEQLSVMGEEQDANTRQGRAETLRQRALREELRTRHMLPISQIARLVYGVPGVDRALVMPKRRADNDALLDAARGMAQAAGKQYTVFVEHGLPVDFLEQLRNATSAIADALGARVESQRRSIVARQTIRQLTKRGNNAVAMLDAIVAPRLSPEPDLLAAWKTVKRPIEVGGSGAATSEEVAAPDQPTTPVVKAA